MGFDVLDALFVASVSVAVTMCVLALRAPIAATAALPGVSGTATATPQ
jgi:hypothetical protein